MIKRSDTKLYLHHYLARALKTIGEARDMCWISPLHLLGAMKEYWHLTSCG